MDRIRKVLEESPLFVGFLLAVFGGAVTAMKNLQLSEKPTPREIAHVVYAFVVHIVTSGFVGGVTAMLMLYTSWHPALEGAIIAMAGTSGMVLLNRLPDILIEWIRKMLGLGDEKGR